VELPVRSGDYPRQYTGCVEKRIIQPKRDFPYIGEKVHRKSSIKEGLGIKNKGERKSRRRDGKCGRRGGRDNQREGEYRAKILCPRLVFHGKHKMNTPSSEALGRPANY
jgi:hypothetical protein